MAVTFSLRGTSLVAHYSTSGSAAGLFTNDANGVPALAVGTSFGSSDIAFTLTSGTAMRGMNFPGLLNLSNNQAFAVLIRLKPAYTGSPTQNRSLWQVTSGITSTGFGTMRMYHGSNGKLHIWVSRCGDGLDCFDVDTTASWSPVSGTYYDVMFSWDGSTTAGAMKFSIDGVELETRTATRARTNQDIKYTPGLIIGGNYNQPGMNASLNEFVFFDNAEAHVYSARSDFYTVAAFDGSVYTNPGIANVRSSTAYTQAGLPYTGTAAIPVAANVRFGTSTDATTGTLVVPSTADVRYGTNFDTASTGILNLPVEANVVAGVTYDNATKTGTFTTPTSAEIADAVWDEATAGHVSAGSFGKFVQTLLTVGKFLGLK